MISRDEVTSNSEQWSDTSYLRSDGKEEYRERKQFGNRHAILVTAFMGADILNFGDWSGRFDWTLDVLGTNNPNASGWLTYGTGHNGDFGFSMIEVPEPGTLSLLGAGLLGLAFARRKKAA